MNMTSRESVLWRIAELYTDLTDPLNGPSGVPGTGTSSGLHGHESSCLLNRSSEDHWTPPRCSCSNQTIREYERLVKLMRDDRSEPLVFTSSGKLSVRSLWWHLEHWHHRAQRVTRHYPVTAKAGGKTITLRNQDGTPVTRPTIAHLRDPKASEQKAQLAITWIANHWALPVEPMLPAPVLEGFKVAA